MNKTLQQPKRSVILKGVFLILIIIFTFQFGARYLLIHAFGLTKPNGTILFISRLFYWLIALFAWYYAVKIEKQSLFLWKEEKHNFQTYLLSVIAMIGIIFIANAFIQSIIIAVLHHKENSIPLHQMLEIFRSNKFLLIFSMFTAGVTEELIFRVYLLQRLELLLKNSYLAIFISTVLFALLHIGYGTISNVTGPFIMGLVFAIHYWKYRNIKFIIIFHFLWDLLTFYYLLGHYKS